MRRFSGLLFAVWLAISPGHSAAAADPVDGASIYRRLCAECHGYKGEGVSGKYDEPLVGDDSVARLTRIIHKTMPEDSAERCVDADAAAVAAFIHGEFYAPDSRLRRNASRIELSRLTVRQYRESVADLLASFLGGRQVDERRGLEVNYYKSRGYSSKRHAFKRIDSSVDFDYGEGVPEGEGFKSEEFSARWEGSVLADETGWHEFVIQTENGAQLFVNGRGKPLIDGYVATGDRERRQKARLFLLGGRAYPLELQWFKYKGKTASIRLSWIPPNGVEEIIPARNLCPVEVAPVMVVKQAFPPDDSSAGYERGVSVSRAWDDAVTYAALETADWVQRNLDRVADGRSGDEDRGEKLRRFCRSFAERAFRQPLDDGLREFFVDRFFDRADKPEYAVKQSVLLSLKSPRFLFPGLRAAQVDGHVVAERLALALWDSLPDARLRAAASGGELMNEEGIRRQAERMLRDPRTAAKLRYFFHRWLRMDETESLTKDATMFPGFDPRVIADLRTSLNLFLDDVVWKGDSDYRRLILGEQWMMNGRLARFYGVGYEGDGGFQAVSFNPKERAGVMTHPYLLAIFSHHDSTSPIHRGVFVTRSLLGRSLRPPQMAIEFKDSEFDPGLTMREKIAQLTRPAACQSCHSVINPVGFSLEQYDAVGRFRTVEGGRKIDATAEYQETDGSIVKLGGARELAEYIAGSADAQRGFIRRLFEVMVKQPLAAYGPDSIGRLHTAFSAGGFGVRNLLVEMVVLSAGHGLK